MGEASEQGRKVAVYYAVWATLCAAAAGIVVGLIHTWWFSYIPSRSGMVHTLVSDAVTSLAIAAGQGAVALVTGSVLAHFGRTLRLTLLLGLLLGLFDFVMYFLQMAVPATELGWTPDLLILVAAAIGITLIGMEKPAPV
ncbi:MAG: hypothetical protein ACREL9_03185 [Gemmatimonadales bacterium]